MNKSEIAYQRLYKNGLLKPFKNLTECVYNLAGIQSQLQQFAEISIWNRCIDKISLSDFANLYKRHKLINLWGQRYTLHMYDIVDWDVICDIYDEHVSWKDYKNLYPVEYKEVCKLITNRVHKDGFILRTTINEIVKDKMGHLLGTDDYFESYIIRIHCFNGTCFGIPDKPHIKKYVSYKKLRGQQWKKTEANTLKSIENIMLRYFEFYGPASLDDFRHWSGLPAMVSKEVFNGLRAKLNETLCDKRFLYDYKSVKQSSFSSDKILLLGKFDPLFVSYKHKDWIASEHQVKAIWQSAARVEAVLLEGTKILGTWRHVTKGQKISLKMQPLGKISLKSKKKISQRIEELAVFWEKGLDSIQYE